MGGARRPSARFLLRLGAKPRGSRLPLLTIPSLGLILRPILWDICGTEGLGTNCWKWRFPKNLIFLGKTGRSGVIRTHDPLLPKQMRYQAALRSAIPWGLHTRCAGSGQPRPD
jgi:hypothetical protein